MQIKPWTYSGRRCESVTRRPWRVWHVIRVVSFEWTSGNRQAATEEHMKLLKKDMGFSSKQVEALLKSGALEVETELPRLVTGVAASARGPLGTVSFQLDNLPKQAAISLLAQSRLTSHSRLTQEPIRSHAWRSGTPRERVRRSDAFGARDVDSFKSTPDAGRVAHAVELLCS